MPFVDTRAPSWLASIIVAASPRLRLSVSPTMSSLRPPPPPSAPWNLLRIPKVNHRPLLQNYLCLYETLLSVRFPISSILGLTPPIPPLPLLRLFLHLFLPGLKTPNFSLKKSRLPIRSFVGCLSSSRHFASIESWLRSAVTSCFVYKSRRHTAIIAKSRVVRIFHLWCSGLGRQAQKAHYLHHPPPCRH